MFYRPAHVCTWYGSPDTAAATEVGPVVVLDGVAGYVPLYRIEAEEIADQHGGRGRGETAVPARDENHITMADEAAATALDRSGVSADDLGAVFSASITDHFAEHGIAGALAYRIGATGDVRTADFRSTGRAAADALLAARTFVEAHDAPVLVVAADVMPTSPGDDEETDVGAGAGAAVVRGDDAASPAARLTGAGQETTGIVERHREHGEPAEQGDARFERRYSVRPAASTAIERAGADPERAIASAPGYRLGQAALDAVDAEQVSTFSDVGYAGTATLLIDLAHLLETADAGEPVLAVAYGQGGADALALEVGDGVEADVGLPVSEQIDAKEYVSYAKHLEYRERYDYQGVPSS